VEEYLEALIKANIKLNSKVKANFRINSGIEDNFYAMQNLKIHDFGVFLLDAKM
jgi:hypothetical protein